MRLRNESLAELVRIEPSGTGYELRDGPMTTYMSREGVEMFAQSARIFEALRPCLEAWVEHFASVRCEHGIRFDDDCFSWQVNDYAFDLLTEPEKAVLTFDGGFHGDDYCMPAWFDRALMVFTWDAFVRGPL